MKIINIDIDDKIILKNIEDTDTKTKTSINYSFRLATGNYQSILLNFNFISPNPDGLSLFANFKINSKQQIDVELNSMTIDEVTYQYACYIPKEVFEEVGKTTLGIFGLKLDENNNLEQRISLIPVVGFVVKGSYDPSSKDGITPTPTIFEIYFNKVKDIENELETYKNDYEKFVSLYNSKPYYFENIATLKTSKLKERDIVITLGYYDSNDGGGTLYLVRAKTENDIEDGGSIHFLDNGLVAELIVNDNINVKQFGAYGDNNHNDTVSIQNAINYAQNKEVSLTINRGIYYVSQLIINKSLKLIGENYYYTTIKSIPNNNVDSIITIENNGAFYCDISGFSVFGNKVNNNNNKINGITIYGSKTGISDRYGIFHNLYIYECTGNGILIDGSNTDYDIREVRLDNIILMKNDVNGIYAKSCTDSLFTRITSSFNKENGFLFSSSNNKISNCKAFWNGRGDEDEIDQKRTPYTAYEITSDTSYNSDKTYYTRSGNNIQNNYYVFTKFEGSEFESGTTYFEITKIYYKRFSGFHITGSRNLLANCDAQDNFGDGFMILGSFNTLSPISCDNNGIYIPKGVENSSANIEKYENVGLTQLYYGVYIFGQKGTIINGQFDNFRYENKGASQRGAVFIENSSDLQGDVICNNQVTDQITTQNCYESDITISSNGVQYVLEYDLNSLNLGENLTLNTSGGNSSFVKKINGIVYFKFLFSDTNNNILYDDGSERILTQLPYYLRPTINIFPIAKFSSNSGYESNFIKSAFIASNGNISIRGEHGDVNYKSVIIEGSFTTS